MSFKYARYSTCSSYLIVLTLLNLVIRGSTEFEGWLYIRVIPANTDQALQLYNYHQSTGNVLSKIVIDQSVHILVPPDSVDTFKRRFNKWPNKFDLVSENFSAYIDSHKALPTDPFKFDKYHNLTQIEHALYEMEAKWPNVLKLSSIGKTFEGRNITTVSLTFSSHSSVGSKPKVLFECGIHAREWVSPASCLWIVNYLVTKRPAITKNFDFIFIPVLNADGYAYTWSTERFWRKNRQSQSNSSCVGVDLNRNFATNHFCTYRSTLDPCARTFCGDTPFNQLETRALSNFVQSVARLEVFFSVHSSSQLWIYPTSYKRQSLESQVRIANLAKLAVESIRVQSGSEYISGSTAEVLYEVSGTSFEWMHDKAKVESSFAIELRDKGQHRFLLPPDQIVDTAKELYVGVEAILESIAAANGTSYPLNSICLVIAFALITMLI